MALSEKLEISKYKRLFQKANISTFCALKTERSKELKEYHPLSI